MKLRSIVMTAVTVAAGLALPVSATVTQAKDASASSCGPYTGNNLGVLYEVTYPNRPYIAICTENQTVEITWNVQDHYTSGELDNWNPGRVWMHQTYPDKGWAVCFNPMSGIMNLNGTQAENAQDIQFTTNTAHC